MGVRVREERERLIVLASILMLLRTKNRNRRVTKISSWMGRLKKGVENYFSIFIFCLFCGFQRSCCVEVDKAESNLTMKNYNLIYCPKTESLDRC